MNEWKFKVGDVIIERGIKYKIISKQISSSTYMLLNIKTQELVRVYKERVELRAELIKSKSIYEQALDLLGLKVGDELEVNMFTKGNHWVAFKVLEDGFESLCDFKNLTYHVDLDSLLKNPSSIRNITTPKVKSEAELILDELKVAMDKANEMLKRSVW